MVGSRSPGITGRTGVGLIVSGEILLAGLEAAVGIGSEMGFFSSGGSASAAGGVTATEASADFDSVESERAFTNQNTPRPKTNATAINAHKPAREGSGSGVP